MSAGPHQLKTAWDSEPGHWYTCTDCKVDFYVPVTVARRVNFYCCGACGHCAKLGVIGDLGVPPTQPGAGQCCESVAEAASELSANVPNAEGDRETIEGVCGPWSTPDPDAWRTTESPSTDASKVRAEEVYLNQRLRGLVELRLRQLEGKLDLRTIARLGEVLGIRLLEVTTEVLDPRAVASASARSADGLPECGLETTPAVDVELTFENHVIDAVGGDPAMIPYPTSGWHEHKFSNGVVGMRGRIATREAFDLAVKDGWFEKPRS